MTHPISTVSERDSMDTRNQVQGRLGGFPPLLSAARSFKPSLLLDSNYRRNLYNQIGASLFTSPKTQHSPAEELPHGYAQPYHPAQRPYIEDASGTSMSHGPQIHGRDRASRMDINDVEEEMMQLAIEASKREESSGTGLPQRHDHLEDEDFARAVSLSLKTAEQEKAMRDQQLGVPSLSRRAENNDKLKLKPGSSSLPDRAAEVQDHPVWGRISSEELDEAILVEEALFGGKPERNSSQPTPHVECVPGRGLNPKHVPSSPSTSLGSQQLLQQQQEDEDLASLLSDREKEASTLKEANRSRLKEGESRNEILEGEEFSRSLAAKEASLPPEPALESENAITLVVRMPDGSRRGRRFLKSDKLQFLLDFIDVAGVVKPGTYKLVRPYPKRAFSHDDSSISLHELGLTNKQEALFLELI